MSSSSDPKTVVTGYPAAPHGDGAAAYAYPAPYCAAAAAPPPSSAYYAAAPPPSSSYYAAAPPLRYDAAAATYPLPSSNFAAIRRLFIIAIAVFVIIGAAMVIAGLILRPRVPSFYLSSASVSSFSLASDNISATFDLTLSVHNPNSKMSLRYDDLHAAVFYAWDNIAETSLPPLEQGKGDTDEVRARMVAVGEYIGEDSAKRMAGERGSGGGVVGFDVGVAGRIKLTSGSLTSRSHWMRVYCDDVKISFKDGKTGDGSFVGPPRQCDVSL